MYHRRQSKSLPIEETPPPSTTSISISKQMTPRPSCSSSTYVLPASSFLGLSRINERSFEPSAYIYGPGRHVRRHHTHLHEPARASPIAAVYHLEAVTLLGTPSAPSRTSRWLALSPVIFACSSCVYPAHLLFSGHQRGDCQTKGVPACENQLVQVKNQKPLPVAKSSNPSSTSQWRSPKSIFRRSGQF